MTPTVQNIANEFKIELQKLYGDQLANLILFGSHARGDFNEESDIDFAVILKDQNVRSTAEIFKISEISTKIGSNYSELLSVFPTSSKKISESLMPIFEEIRKDGIVI